MKKNVEEYVKVFEKHHDCLGLSKEEANSLAQNASLPVIEKWLENADEKHTKVAKAPAHKVLKRYDKVLITDKNHDKCGEEAYVLICEYNPTGYGCMINNPNEYTTFISNGQFEFITRPGSIQEVPHFVLDYFN